MNFELTKSIARYFSAFKNIPLLPILIDEQIKVFTLFFRPMVFSRMMDFVKELKTFPQVESTYHRYGGLEFRVSHKEFCHMHGDGLVDILLNRALAEKMIEKGLCTEHHVNAGTGWISYQITPTTAVETLSLMAKCAYELRKGNDVTALVGDIAQPIEPA